MEELRAGHFHSHVTDKDTEASRPQSADGWQSPGLSPRPRGSKISATNVPSMSQV